MKFNILEILKTLATAGIMAIIILQFIVPSTVLGDSMKPNFEDGDYLILNKQAYRGECEPEKGDAVVFRSHIKNSKGENKKLIKRVIGVPGDTVRIANKKVYINGVELVEDYTKDGITNGNVPSVKVPEGSVFCLGDNRLNSTDSRHMEVGFVKESDIIGKVMLRLFPFREFGVIRSV